LIGHELSRGSSSGSGSFSGKGFSFACDVLGAPGRSGTGRGQKIEKILLRLIVLSVASEQEGHLCRHFRETPKPSYKRATVNPYVTDDTLKPEIVDP
jgi:hypothetical protein